MSKYHHRAKKIGTRIAKETRNTKFADKAVLIVAVLEPIITVPQALTIFVHKTAAGVSLSTWVGYEFLTLIWLWYAILHRNRLIFLYQGLFFVVQTFVIIGGIIYGARW